MEWFKGSIPEAISEAKKNNKLLLVYVEGPDDLSKAMTNTYNDAIVAQKLSSADVVALKLASNSFAYHQFCTMYPVSQIPSSYLIEGNGDRTTIKIVGYLPPLEFVTEIDKIFEIHNTDAPKDEICNFHQPSTSKVYESNTNVPLEDLVKRKETMLKIKMPGGAWKLFIFSVDDTLSEVRSFIMKKADACNDFSLRTTLPKREFSTEDELLSLQELGLTPSAVLLINNEYRSRPCTIMTPDRFVKKIVQAGCLKELIEKGMKRMCLPPKNYRIVHSRDGSDVSDLVFRDDEAGTEYILLSDEERYLPPGMESESYKVAAKAKTPNLWESTKEFSRKLYANLNPIEECEPDEPLDPNQACPMDWISETETTKDEENEEM